VLFSTLQSNLKAWCEHHGCPTIQFLSNRLDFVASAPPGLRPGDCRDSHDTQVVLNPSLVFVDSATTASVLETQLEIAGKINLNCHTEERLFTERFECRLYTQKASFSCRKVFAKSFLIRSKVWNAYALETTDQRYVGPKAVQDISIGTSTSPRGCFDTIKQCHPEVTIQWDPQIDSQIGDAINLSVCKSQPLHNFFVRQLTASIDDQIVGSLSLHVGIIDTSPSSWVASQSTNQSTTPSSLSAANIYNFCVQPEFRKQGIGTKLIQAAVEYGRIHGISHLGLFCDPERSGFYQRLGFKSLGVLEEWKSSSSC
jgi:GNAT superfamily N-acetyltransferase